MVKNMPRELHVCDNLNVWNDPKIFGGEDGKHYEKYVRADLYYALRERLERLEDYLECKTDR